MKIKSGLEVNTLRSFFLKMKFKDPKGNDYSIEFKKPNVRGFGECDGFYYYPKNGKGRIQIDPKMSKQAILNALIHEVTHSYFDEATETKTTNFANCLSRLIYNDLQFRSDNLKSIIK